MTSLAPITEMRRIGRLRNGRDPMRIALVTERFDGLAGGLERWTVQLAAHLLQRGHEVHVVTFAEANHALPVVLHVLDHKRSVLARGQAVEACLERLRPDIAHDTGSGWSGDVFHPQTGSHLSSLDRFIAARDPVRRMMAGLSPSMALRRWRMAKLEVLQASMARHVIAVSHRIAHDLADRHGVPESFISVIPNGVETARFAPPRLARFRDATRRTLGVGTAWCSWARPTTCVSRAWTPRSGRLPPCAPPAPTSASWSPAASRTAIGTG